MALTTAPTGIYIGGALGVVAGLATQSLVIGVVVVIVASIACWYGIRAVEKLLGRGLDAGLTAISNRYSPPAPSCPQYQQLTQHQPMTQPPPTSPYSQHPAIQQPSQDPRTQPLRLPQYPQRPLNQQAQGQPYNAQQQYSSPPYAPIAQPTSSMWTPSTQRRGNSRWSDLRPYQVVRILGALFALCGIAFAKFRGVTTTTEYNLETGATTTSSNLGSLIVVVILSLLLAAACLVAERYLRHRNVDWPSSIRGQMKKIGLASNDPSHGVPGGWADQPGPRDGGTQQLGQSPPFINGNRGAAPPWHQDAGAHLHNEYRRQAAAHFNDKDRARTAQFERRMDADPHNEYRRQAAAHFDASCGAPPQSDRQK